jgi:hypothetical protein
MAEDQPLATPSRNTFQAASDSVRPLLFTARGCDAKIAAT